MFFLEFPSFLHDPVNVGNLISGSSAFSKTSLNIWKFMIHVLLKPGLENFEHYFTSVWDECNCAVIWTFFGIAFLWDWNENWPFPVLWPLLGLPDLLTYWKQHLDAIILEGFESFYWNSITSTSFIKRQNCKFLESLHYPILKLEKKILSITILTTWKFFSTALLGNSDEDWPFPVLWPLVGFPDLLTHWVQHFDSIIF